MPSIDQPSQPRLTRGEYTAWSLRLELTPNSLYRAELSSVRPTFRQGINCRPAKLRRFCEALSHTSSKYQRQQPNKKRRPGYTQSTFFFRSNRCYLLDLTLRQQSLQYTGLSSRGSNGTSVSLPQSAHTAGNIWRGELEPQPPFPFRCVFLA